MHGAARGSLGGVACACPPSLRVAAGTRTLRPIWKTETGKHRMVPFYLHTKRGRGVLKTEIIFISVQNSTFKIYIEHFFGNLKEFRSYAAGP